jgi:catechol 2,3-dioxygenase-like lactoylglutathione lyase family enzyme
MSKRNVKFINLAAVLISSDVVKTAEYYSDVMGFKVVKHFDGKEKFAALYRDEIEIIIVQSKYGEVQSNRQKYGAGYDVYITPDTVEGVDIIYSELRDKEVKIISTPQMTEYGSYEFVVEDIDGRLIGIGQIKNKEQFFKKAGV